MHNKGVFDSTIICINYMDSNPQTNLCPSHDPLSHHQHLEHLESTNFLGRSRPLLPYYINRVAKEAMHDEPLW